MKVVTLWISALALMLSSLTVNADEIDSENPFRMLEQIAERMTTRIAQERSQIESNPRYLRTIMEEELLPYSDYQFAARSVLARNWQRLNEDQQQEFVEVFREYLITTYARVFTQYDETKHQLRFGRGGDYEGQRRVVVRAQLIEEGGRPPIRLDFHLQRRNPNAPWMAFDLVAEGVSMLNTQQAEMQSSLRQNGIEGTIQLLRDRANVEIRLDEDLDVSDFTG
ncbi:MlaC/ttg2D family ABC transporter substrate-binding protein [Aliidiomarina sanyensis]|uniref:Organic solvent ABC transporter n=1 Tax=Aliidiomarina sanyensis TaxID=1249555 RepID=A0A432WKG0_9GAMM|nr:ABC transporter substrate-binding protein [Aliidiomarina sanyensis]RUO34179.1 organic solvent ABC transporter [Aliidiomarina sanyensis]